MIYKPAEDSHLLAKHIPKYVCNNSFLDMGAGSGIQSEIALKNRAKEVLAIDIDPEVVKHLTKKHIKALQSDLFLEVKGKFDVIAFNPPYLPEDEREDKESSKITSGGKNGDEIIIRFLKQAKKHLSKNGVILLIVSSLTPRKKIEQHLKKEKLKKILIDKEKMFMEVLELWEIRAAQ